MSKLNREVRTAECDDEYIRMIVNHVIKKFQFPRNYFDDFLSDAYVGYLQAVENYDPEQGVPFKNFAFHRIRGSIIDGARRMTELSPQMYRNLKAYQALSDIRDHELSTHLEGGAKIRSKYQSLTQILSYVHKGGLIFRLANTAYHDHIENQCTDEGSPDVRYEQKVLRHSIRLILDVLPEKQRAILHMYYFEDKTFQECGEELGISKSWVSRIHNMALDTLRNEWLKEQRKHEVRD